MNQICRWKFDITSTHILLLKLLLKYAYYASTSWTIKLRKQVEYFKFSIQLLTKGKKRQSEFHGLLSNSPFTKNYLGSCRRQLAIKPYNTLKNKGTKTQKGVEFKKFQKLPHFSIGIFIYNIL